MLESHSCSIMENRGLKTIIAICLMLPWIAMTGLSILNHPGKTFGKENIGLYRDDGLAIIKNRSARLANKTRKKLHKIFEQFDLKISMEANLHVVNFLDVTFDFTTGKHKPYRKPNSDPLYIHKHSNHPPNILRQLPTSINRRISTLSSDKQVFDDAVQAYQNVLGHSNFSHKLKYMPQETHKQRRSRQHNIIWFNLSFSKNAKTNIARRFLNLVKVSYSCRSNVRSIITSHNTRIIRRSQSQNISTDNCN